MMRQKSSSIKRIFVALTSVAIIASFLLAPVHSARAIVPVIDAPNLAENIISAVMSKAIDFTTNLISSNTNALVVKEYVLDPIAWGLAQSLIHQLSQSVIQWIKTGDSRGPSFIENFLEHFTREMDNAVGLWLEKYFGRNSQLLGLLCEPFRLTLPPLLQANARRLDYTERARCKLSDIVRNVENFNLNIYYNDFSHGGWDAWFATLDWDNNFPGQYLMGISRQDEVANAALFASQTEVQTTGGGLLSWQQCDDVVVPGYGDEPGEVLKGNCRIQTPGGLVNDQLKQAFGNDIERLRLADEINEVISALIETMISSLISPSGGGFSGTNFNAPPPAAVDTSAPQVFITSPSANQTISTITSIPITATASDDVGVLGVRFFVNNVQIGAEDTSLPYQTTWNPSSSPPGQYTLSATARDASGKTGSNSIIIRVPSSTSATTFP